MLGIPARPLSAQSTVIFASRQMQEHFRGHLAPARPTAKAKTMTSSKASKAEGGRRRRGGGGSAIFRGIDQASSAFLLSAENEGLHEGEGAS